MAMKAEDWSFHSAPVLTCVLHERLVSRGEVNSWAKLPTAMRFQFRRHVERLLASNCSRSNT